MGLSFSSRYPLMQKCLWHNVKSHLCLTRRWVHSTVVRTNQFTYHFTAMMWMFTKFDYTRLCFLYTERCKVLSSFLYMNIVNTCDYNRGVEKWYQELYDLHDELYSDGIISHWAINRVIELLLKIAIVLRRKPLHSFALQC